MLFEFMPWQLDVDIESTKLFYESNDYSKDKALNQDFIDSLTKEQKYFFDSLGVDLLKIEIDEAVYDIPEDGEMPSLKIKRLSVDFLMKGEILALPQYQKDLYTDEEVFWKTFPDTVKVLSSADEDYLKTYDNEIFKEWDCGYILGTILIMQDM